MVSDPLYYFMIRERLFILKNKMHYRFAGISWEVNWKSIIHFHGVTRIRLNAIARNGTSLESVSSYIRDRLKKVYDFDFDKW